MLQVNFQKNTNKELIGYSNALLKIFALKCGQVPYFGGRCDLEGFF